MHHHLTVEDLGIRPLQARVPFLIGGHGRRVVGISHYVVRDAEGFAPIVAALAAR